MDTHAAEDDPHSTPMSLPESGDTGEGGKLKMIVQLVKKCLGVKDIASMFVSACYPTLRAPAVHVLIVKQASLPSRISAGAYPEPGILALPR